MSKKFFLLCAFFSLTTIGLFSDETVASSNVPSSTVPSKKLPWTTNFAEAQSTAKSGSLPILLLFTGSDWCAACQNLDRKVFSTDEFAQDAADKFVFVKVDFPKRAALDPSTRQQNEGLQKKYKVAFYPTVILVDDQGNLIGQVNYKLGGPKHFLHLLNKKVEEYRSRHK